MLLLDIPRFPRDDALLGHEKLRFVALAAHVLNAAYEGVLAEDLIDINNHSYFTIFEFLQCWQ